MYDSPVNTSISAVTSTYMASLPPVPPTTTCYSWPSDGSGGYWQWVPYQYPAVTTPVQRISYDFGLAPKLKLAMEVVKALPADDPLAVAARQAIADGLV